MEQPYVATLIQLFGSSIRRRFIFVSEFIFGIAWDRFFLTLLSYGDFSE